MESLGDSACPGSGARHELNVWTTTVTLHDGIAAMPKNPRKAPSLGYAW